MSRAEAIRRLEQEVGVMVRRVKRVIGVRARAVHEDLQPASYLVLAYLAEHGPMRASDVREVFGLDKGAISRQAQHLLDLGLLDRSPDPHDRRATLLTVTAEARRRLSEVAEHRREWLDERLGDWTTAELVDFVSVLGRYNAALSRPDDAVSGRR